MSARPALCVCVCVCGDDVDCERAVCGHQHPCCSTARHIQATHRPPGCYARIVVCTVRGMHLSVVCARSRCVTLCTWQNSSSMHAAHQHAQLSHSTSAMHVCLYAHLTRNFGSRGACFPRDSDEHMASARIACNMCAVSVHEHTPLCIQHALSLGRRATGVRRRRSIRRR
jgi:hypothetical protein